MKAFFSSMMPLMLFRLCTEQAEAMLKTFYLSFCLLAVCRERPLQLRVDGVILQLLQCFNQLMFHIQHVRHAVNEKLMPSFHIDLPLYSIFDG